MATPSRLHFGLLALHPDSPRLYGGVGLMVEEPGLELTVGSAATDAGPRCFGPLAGRAEEFADRFLSSLDEPTRIRTAPFRMDIVRAAPEHAGLGTGTQLGMAVAAALAEWVGLPKSQRGPAELAHRVGRGARSAIGIHGFARGGLLVEGGKRRPDDVSPLVARLDFPEHWRVVLLIPGAFRGLSGRRERQAFADLPPVAQSVTDRLCSIVLLGLLPAAAEADLPGFSEALFELQRQVGSYFRPAQGGVYADPLLEQAVSFLRSQGIVGVGQSSWGPTLYAVTDDPDRAEHAAEQLRRRFPEAGGEVIVTRAANSGARITSGGRSFPAPRAPLPTVSRA